MLVVDTNIIAYLLIPGQRTPEVKQVLRKDPDWIAPVLWKSEFRNVLALYLRKKLLTLHKAVQLMQKAENLMYKHEYIINSLIVLKLSLESGCSAYDCEYVALAQEKTTPFLTYDKKIINQFPNTVLTIEEFLGS